MTIVAAMTLKTVTEIKVGGDDNASKNSNSDDSGSNGSGGNNINSVER